MTPMHLQYPSSWEKGLDNNGIYLMVFKVLAHQTKYDKRNQYLKKKDNIHNIFSQCKRRIHWRWGPWLKDN